MTKRKRGIVEDPQSKIKRLVGDEKVVQAVRSHRLNAVLPTEYREDLL